MTLSHFAFPTPIHFGAGARKEVAAHLLAQGRRRPLIVTDRALAALPVMAEFNSHLTGLNVAPFDGVFGNPTCAQVVAGVGVYPASSLSRLELGVLEFQHLAALPNRSLQSLVEASG